MLVHDAQRLFAEQEFIRAHEPCVGSGAMVIALAQALHEEGINYQQCLHVTAIDLDIVASIWPMCNAHCYTSQPSWCTATHFEETPTACDARLRM